MPGLIITDIRKSHTDSEFDLIIALNQNVEDHDSQLLSLVKKSCRRLLVSEGATWLQQDDLEDLAEENLDDSSNFYSWKAVETSKIAVPKCFVFFRAKHPYLPRRTPPGSRNLVVAWQLSMHVVLLLYYDISTMRRDDL
jgi:hypothetical protein